MSKIPAINEIDANSPSQESTEVVVKATTVTPDINEIQETISASATIQEIDGTRKPTISEIYKIVNDGLFESTTNWWDYAYKISQAQLNQDIISRLDNGVIGGGYSKGVDIITTTSNKVPTNTNVYSALKSDSLYPKKLNDEVINGIYDFLNGLTIGKPTAYTGGTWSVDQTGRTHLTTDYLYVRLKAIFETLQIFNVDTIGGKLVISPAGSIRVAYVDRIKIDAPVFIHNEETDVWSISQVEDAEGNLVNETLNQEVYRCYFLGEQDGEEIDNKWKIGDQAQAKTFNVKKGTYHKVENSYLWRLVVNVSSDTVDIDGKKYHYVDLSQIDFDSASDAPAPGDVLNQLGHRLNDAQRQTALVLNAVDNYAPSITLYAGINYYTLLNKEYVEFGVYNGKAFFNVYGDMYIGDKGDNPKTYIKYKNGKINIKANLEIGSSIGDKDLDQYIKENGGVDEETVKNLINNAQVIKDLQKQTDGAIETWFYEGVPTLDNLPAVDWNTNELKKIHIGDLYYDQTTGYAYRFTKYNDDVTPYRWNRIKDNDIVAALEAANHAQATADGKMKVFYGETKPTNYQVGDMWVNATLEGKFNNDIARAVAKSESFNADDWVLASRYSEAIATIQKWTNEYETKFSNLVDEVKQQKDQSIVVWYYGYEPTVDNAPANAWNTNELRSEHIGDIFYDIKNNHSYRWTGTDWVQIKDADFNEAMKAAKAADDKAGAAGDLADSKRRIFYSDTTPNKPFDKGDLWIKQVGDKTETWVYNGTNWVKSEDKDLADFSAAINEELAGIKGQLDGKAETWYQVDDPSKSWTDKASHEGDIWYNTTNGTTNYWNGSAWEQMDIPKDVFDTIDGKSSIFVDSYADAKAGTGVINKGYKERDLWILPEDATVNGVKYYKGDMLTAVSNNTNFDETNWKKKVRYVGQTELTNAIDIVNDKINTINNTTIPGINNKFNEFIKDGVLDSSEKARLTDLLNQASNEVAAVVDQVNNITTSKYLTNDNANKGKLEEANTVMNTAWTEYSTFINTLIDANTEITKVNIGEANTKYKNLQEKIKAVKQYLAICQADVLNGMGTDITSYKYLKEAFKGKTEINGGLVVTNVLQLRQTSDASSPITAGISGLQGKANADGVVDKDTYDITSIAAWFGGPMVDKDIFTDEQLNNKVAGTDYARSLFRHDGSGYLASGAIYWGTDGVLHGDPNSFILQGTSFATIFYYIRLFYLHYANPDATDFNNINYVTPMKTFSRLSVLPLGGIEEGHNLPTGLFIGDSNTGGSFQIGNIILRTKSGDPNILEIVSADSNKTAHLGVQGGVSAYGTYTPFTGGGGGLNATVVSYANIIAGNYNDTDLTTIPNAYSIKALYTAIQNIDVTSQLGNYLLKTDAANIYQPKGNYLTTHQTIYGLTIQKNGANVGTYNPKTKATTINVTVPTKISELSNDSGYTDNIGTVTSVGISVPTGLSVTNSPITTKGIINIAFAEGYSIPTVAKQTSWDGAVNVKHTHTNKTVLDGISSSKVTNWDNVYNWYVLMTTNEEDTDGIINKWNEVVSFLANITQTDTLSGIVDGINKSISDEVTRAKKAEGVNASGISTNKTNITTLQSYFTNGSAKKALQLTNARKLWGNSFNGTADINGSIIVPDGKYISIGNIKMEYDATNKALKITNTTTNEVANLYTSGGVSAYGVGTSSSSSGGLNGSVKAYADAIRLTTENLFEIASAYSVAKLYSEIQNVANAIPSINVSVPTAGNALTDATYDTSTGMITFTKGTFLTTHQSLDGYVNEIAVSGSGNAITAVSKSGKKVTFTKGATYLTAHQSLSNYYTKSSVDSLLNGKSATTHTHSVKINGITKTIAASGGDAVDLGTYLTTHQSLADYATQNWVKNKATAHNADMVDNYHASGLFTGFSISDVANKVTISIGGTSKALNLVRAFPSGVGNNFNDIATHGNSMGMSYIEAPYDSSTANYQTLNGYVNPNGQTGWHHYINLSYTDSNNTATSPNMWQTQFAIKAGTTEVYVRSRAGGKISNSDAWAAPWVRLARVTDNVASASKVANALSWSGYSSGSYNGSAAKSISIPNNTNQLTNGAGFITASASISGNAGSATKLQNSRTINGTSFNGTANIVTSYWGTTRKLWGNSVNGNADVNGSITIANTDGVYVQIGDVRLVYDKANTAIKVVKSDGTTAANFYATGGITAYGEGSGSSGGGGLNGSVKSYADALKLASESLSEIASAYSIKQLSTRITSLEGGSATSISVSGSGNAVTSVTKNGTTISVVKGATFLTSHQSLANYLLKTDAANIYQPKGNYLTSQSLDGYATQSWVNNKGYLTSHQDISGKVNKNGDTISGILKFTNVLQNNRAIDIEFNYSAGFARDIISLHNSVYGSNEYKVASIGVLCYPNNTSNGFYYIYIGSGDYEAENNLRIYKDKVTFGSKTIIDSGSIGNQSVSYANSAGNADTVDGIHANGLLTALSNSNNGISITVGGTTKSVSNISVNYATSAENASFLSRNDLNSSDNLNNAKSGLYCSYNTNDPSGSFTTNCITLSLANRRNDKLQITASLMNTGDHVFVRLAQLVGDNTYERWTSWNALAYITDNVASATKLQTPRTIWGQRFDGTGNVDGTLTAHGNILATGGITAYSSSDVRLKTNITKLNCLKVIKSIGGTYEFDYIRDRKHSIGFIAQNVNNPLLNDIIAKDDNGYLKINYWSPKLIATAFGAIEQVDDEVSKLKARVKHLESEVERLTNDNRKLEATNNKLLISK